MALSIAYPRARHASALLVAGFLFGLSSVALASTPEVWPSGARLRFSTTGVPVWTTPPVPTASAAGSGGSVLLRATQALNIGGVSVPVALSRNVPVSNVARVLAVGARFLGPLAVAGLIYEGVRYVNGEWVAEAPAEIPSDPQRSRPIGTRYRSATGVFGSSPAELCTGVRPHYFQTFAGDPATSMSALSSDFNVPGSPYVSGQIGTCGFTAGVEGDRAVYVQQYCPAGAVPGAGPQYGCVWPVACPAGEVRASDGSCSGGEPATEDDLQISFQQGLIEAPTMGPTLLDIALQDSRARAKLLAEAMQLNGPATVEGPKTTTVETGPGGDTTINRSITYNVTFAGDVVTVTETTTTTNVGPAGTTTTTTTTEVPTASEPQAAAPAEDIECGLPGMPKCAIDETGTPDGAGTDQAGMDAINNGAGAIEDGITGIGDAPIADLGFGLDVDLPAGNCSPLVLSYKSWSHTTNWCPTLGIARDIWGWFIGIMGALYVFRRATNPEL